MNRCLLTVERQMQVNLGVLNKRHCVVQRKAGIKNQQEKLAIQKKQLAEQDVQRKNKAARGARSNPSGVKHGLTASYNGGAGQCR